MKLLKTSCPEWFDGVKLTRKASNQIPQDLLEYEKLYVIRKVKIGILYAKAGQTTEAEMYNNGKPFMGCEKKSDSDTLKF